MHQGKWVNRIIVWGLLAAVLCYLGGAAYRSFHNPYRTTLSYAAVWQESIETTGWLCRTEEVLPQTGNIVEVLPAEGEKVAVGAAVAAIYENRAGLERAEELKRLRTEEKQLADALAAAEDMSHVGRDSHVLLSAREMRSALESENFIALSRAVTQFKSAVYIDCERYGDGQSTLATTLSGLRDEIRTLEQTDSGSSTEVTAPKSGVFSGNIDGYENILTTDEDTLYHWKPSLLDALSENRDSVRDGSLGKLITSSRWYFICTMSESDARRLANHASFTVRFSHDWSGDVVMTTERIGAPESGRVSVLLSSDRFLSDTTLLRKQTVQIILNEKNGIRVPMSALRVEDGESVVYAKIGVRAERKKVRVLAAGEDYYLVEPDLEEDAGMRRERLALRPGDAVIIAARDIRDGLIIE